MHLCYCMIHCNILLYVLYWTQNININLFLGRPKMFVWMPKMFVGGQKCLCGCLNSVSSPQSSLVDEAIQVVEVLVAS